MNNDGYSDDDDNNIIPTTIIVIVRFVIIIVILSTRKYTYFYTRDERISRPSSAEPLDRRVPRVYNTQYTRQSFSRRDGGDLSRLSTVTRTTVSRVNVCVCIPGGNVQSELPRVCGFKSCCHAVNWLHLRPWFRPEDLSFFLNITFILLKKKKN